MKKLSKILIACLLIVAAIIPFAACGQTGDFSYGMGFGDVHWNEMGAITVKTNKDKEIVDVVIDGIFLPFNWVVPAAGETSAWTADVRTAHSIKAAAVHPDSTGTSIPESNRFILIGDKYFEAKADAASTIARGSRTIVEYFEIGGSGIQGLHAYVLDEAKQENGRWFYEMAMQGKCFILREKDATATSNEARFEKVCQAYGNEANGVRTINKRSSQYWPASTSNLGLKVNMAYLEAFIKSTKTCNYTKSQISYSATTGQTTVAGTVVAGATASDSPLYIAVALHAYAAATK